MKKVITTAELVFIIIIGFLFSYFGKMDERYIWLLPFGGAFIGSGLSALIGRVNLRDIRDQITSSLKDGFSSDAVKILPYRKKWYVYYGTQEDNIRGWRLSIIDFNSSNELNKLSTTTHLIDKAGHELPYSVEAGIRGQHFILFYNSKDRTDSNLYVFPIMGFHSNISHYGILHHETWDKAVDSVSPTIIAPKFLSNCEKIGRIPDDEAKILDDEWHKKMAGMSTISRMT
jgi:hypothetical protein